MKQACVFFSAVVLLFLASCDEEDGSTPQTMDAAETANGANALDAGNPGGAVDALKVTDGHDATGASDAEHPDLAVGSPPPLRVAAVSGILPQNACPPWTLVDTAIPEDPVIEDGHFLLKTSDNPETLFYSQQTPQVLAPPVLIVEARVKLVTSTSATPSRSAAQFGFTAGRGHWKNMLAIEAGKIFLLADENVRGPEATAKTTDAFHTYRMTVDTTSGTIAVTQDGVDLLSGQAFVDPGFADERIFFGEGSVFASGHSEWEYLEHNAANVALCPR